MCKYTSTGLCSAVMQARASFSLHDLETVGGPTSVKKTDKNIVCNATAII